MIKLNDLLHLSDEQLQITKVKFNKHNGFNNPIDLYISNRDLINKQWLYWRTEKRYFSVGQIAICLVRISSEHWLLTTIDTVDKELNVSNGINYTGTPIKEYESFFGRIIIKFHKTFQPQTVYFNTIGDELEVCQIIPSVFDGDDFIGYDKVKLSYFQLQNIIKKWKRDWVSALESQKAVYLITDTNNGKLYVGSATSDNGMLLKRWEVYVENGHGGNKNLIQLVNEKGIDYIKNYFQYSILENYNSTISDELILERESWWKEVLKTRIFGYNAN